MASTTSNEVSGTSSTPTGEPPQGLALLTELVGHVELHSLVDEANFGEMWSATVGGHEVELKVCCDDEPGHRLVNELRVMKALMEQPHARIVAVLFAHQISDHRAFIGFRPAPM